MRYVIIGTSAAGLAGAETLRRLAPKARITLISDESHLPYSRPLLTYLLGRETTREKLFLRSPDYFREWGFEALLGTPVTRMAPGAHEVHLADGRALPYDRLLIASGARPRLPPIPGLELSGVFTLRHLADVERLERHLAYARRVAVVGAGAVGLKAADALAHRGLAVDLLARGAQPLSKVLDQVSARLLMEAIARLGISLHLNSWPTAVVGNGGRVTALAQNDGRELPTDAVLFSVGVAPRVEFLAGTTLAAPEGIPVDEHLQTGDPDIFAAGDCVLPRHLLTGAPAAFHIWPAAVAQGEVAGANLAGAARRYDGILPMNSISLRGCRIITGGHLTPDTPEGEIFEELDAKTGRFTRLVFDQGRLVGATLVGEVRHAGIYFRLIANRTPVKDLPVDPRSPHFHPGRLWARPLPGAG
jgi:NAD(P)H-nitrite reductase large subunit